MLLIARRSLMANRLRLLMTALAVVLGVGFVAGTYILTDGLDKAFTTLFEKSNEGIDVSVRAKDAEPSTQQASSQGSVPDVDPNSLRIPESVLPVVESVAGVDVARPVVQGSAQIIREDGELVGGQGPPTLGFSWSDRADLGGLTVTKGRGPTAPGEMIADEDAVEKAKASLGDTLTIVFDGGRETGEFTLVGVARFGEDNALSGATLSAFEMETAQRYFNAEGHYDEIAVTGEDGVAPSALRDRIQSAVGADYQVITGAQSTEEDIKGVGQGLTFFKYITLGFAAISLFVASFIIFNTFSITIAQRMRELGLLRAVGASRNQIVRLVLLEGIVIGVIASILGIIAGVGIAQVLHSGLNAMGFSMPEADLTVETRTIVVSLIVGIGVTTFAALIPALRAARTAPLEALRDSAGVHRPSLLRRLVGTAASILTLVGGAALLLSALLGAADSLSASLSMLGGGFVLLIIGVTLVGTVFVRPVVAVAGWPLRRMGISGELASRNATRNPRRSMTTAAALMIGLGLASFATIFTSSVQETFSRNIDRALGADLTLSNKAGATQEAYLSPQIATRAAEVDGVASAIGIRIGFAEAKDADLQVLAVEDDRIDEAFRLTMVDGDTELSSAGEVLVADRWAAEHGVDMGDTVKIGFPGDGKDLDARVVGVYEDTSISNMILPISAWKRSFPVNRQLDTWVFVDLEDDASPATVRKAIAAEFEDDRYVQIQDVTEIKKQVATQINQLLALLFALLGLSVIIALFGIINTLALSVFERTRELGLLRAVGATRTQVRRMVRGESILVALLGALLGLLLGLALGWAGVYALRSEGLVLALPWTLVAMMLLIGIVAGVLAAVLPARRAARLDVLQAISSE